MPACSSVPKAGWEWESVSAIPASAGRQNRKIFVSLIEKIFEGVQLKNVEKIFLFYSPLGERKRWAGLSPVGRQSKVSVRILGEIGSDFVQKAPPCTGESTYTARYHGFAKVMRLGVQLHN